MRSAAAAQRSAEIRCAIYTRKSTEDGLDQAFNSLDAQREACRAYVLSQAGEGWVASDELYDDGGISGGTMERPALQRLLAEVRAGHIQVIVVYKVDRLTRSLADFAKIVETLDAAGASFVSVTQAFNTTTSMGRLTLNVLLSFAQFEREVTGERIRDKIAASKRKGLWMGGPVPLGYDVKDRKLVPNAAEADQVIHIYRTYLEVGSVRELADRLADQGLRTKVQVRASGPHRGGCVFRRGGLFHLLQNRIYRGYIVHRGEAYPGDHEAIVPEALWDAVQAKLAANGPGQLPRGGRRSEALLTGILRDAQGRRMTPSQSNKPGRRYRYYVTLPSEQAGSGEAAWRVSAHDIEAIALARLVELLRDGPALQDWDADASDGIIRLDRLLAGAIAAAGHLGGSDAAVRRQLFRTLVQEVVLGETTLQLTLRLDRLIEPDNRTDAQRPALVVSAPVARVRKGHDIRLIVPADAQGLTAPPGRDEPLVRLLAEALATREQLTGSGTRSVEQFAIEARACRKRVAQLIRISYLSPTLVKLALAGEQPAALTRRALLDTELPVAWADQHRLFGLGNTASR